MSGGSKDAVVLKPIHTLFSIGAIGNLTAGQLLELFVGRREGATEAVFAALVQRHGPMVLRVCRQVLGDAHDAQDAFQATFLVLVRRAGSVRNRDSVASWLYGVAHRVAQRARADAARRSVHERRSAALAAKRVGDGDGDQRECWPELHEEIAGLPDKYRAAVVLCYLEGLTTEVAAQKLGCPQATVLSRLSRARQQLRGRLSRRGLAVPAGLWAVGGDPTGATAAVPASLANATIRAALPYAAGQVTAGAIPASVSALTGTVLRTMLMGKVRMSVVILLMLGLLSAGAIEFVRQKPAGPGSVEVHPADGAKPISTARSDNEEIQGTWRVMSAQDNGRPVPEKAKGGKQTYDLKLYITFDTITFILAGEIPLKGTYRLDPTKRPKWIDITGPDGRPCSGIYTLQGDDLTICYNEAGTVRPTRFASESNPRDPQLPRTPNDVLLVLEREIPRARGTD